MHVAGGSQDAALHSLIIWTYFFSLPFLELPVYARFCNKACYYRHCPPQKKAVIFLQIPYAPMFQIDALLSSDWPLILYSKNGSLCCVFGHFSTLFIIDEITSL